MNRLTLALLSAVGGALAYHWWLDQQRRKRDSLESPNNYGTLVSSIPKQFSLALEAKNEQYNKYKAQADDYAQQAKELLVKAADASISSIDAEAMKSKAQDLQSKANEIYNQIMMKV